MLDDINIKLKTTLEADESKSAQQIESQLPSITGKIKGKVKVVVEADAGDAAKTIQQSVNTATTSQKTRKLAVPVDIDLRISNKQDYLRRKLEQDFKTFQSQSKALKIDTSAFESAFSSNALKDAREELTILFKTLRAISAADISKLPDLSITNFSENVRKATSDMDTLQARVNALSFGDKAGITKQITDARTELQELSKIEPGGATDEHIAKFNALKLSIGEITSALTTLRAEDRNFKIDIGAEKLQTDIERAKQSLLNMKTDYSAMFKNVELSASWDTLWETVNSGAIKSRAELTAFNAQFNLLNKQTVGAGLNMKNFWGRTADNFKKFASWFAIGGFTASFVRSIREMISTIGDLNKAVVNIQIATNAPRNQAVKMLKEYAALGREIGATTSQVANAATDWLRQGFNEQQTAELIKSSMVLSKVGALESAAATEYLTTAIKGYKLEVKDSISVVDKLAAVDLKSATSAGGLAEGMAQVANNADMANISMEKLLGYLAVIGETTGGSMSSVGNSASTILSRMGNVKLARLKDYENNGEDLSNVETVLRGKGIKLRDTVNEFRDFGEVLDETAASWETYDSVSKRAIASAFAGKDHMEDFLVLMENYDKATEYTAVASDSAGTAMKKFADYQSGVEASTNRATAAFEQFSNAMLDSGVISGFYDAKAGILGFLTNIVDYLKLIPTLAGAAAAALSFKNKGKTMPTNTQLLYGVLAQ